MISGGDFNGVDDISQGINNPGHETVGDNVVQLGEVVLEHSHEGC